jgi:hypothetical protein
MAEVYFPDPCRLQDGESNKAHYSNDDSSGTDHPDRRKSFSILCFLPTTQRHKCRSDERNYGQGQREDEPPGAGNRTKIVAAYAPAKADAPIPTRLASVRVSGMTIHNRLVPTAPSDNAGVRDYRKTSLTGWSDRYLSWR